MDLYISIRQEQMFGNQAHTFIFDSIIYVHCRWSRISFGLGILVFLKPPSSLFTQMQAKGLWCMRTGIKPRLQMSPVLEERRDCHLEVKLSSGHGKEYSPICTISFQLEWLIWASRTSCWCAKDTPLRHWEILFNEAHNVFIISPLTCFTPWK